MATRTEDGEVARLLTELRAGEPDAGARLYEVLYSKLYAIARGLAPGNTLGPTALVNEAYVRLAPRTQAPNNRLHFLRLVARAMRHTVIDHYRVRGRKVGSLEDCSDVQEPRLDSDKDPLDPLLLDEALAELERLSPDQVRIAELRLFSGYSTAESAEVLGISTPTAERRWRAAKAFLRSRLG